MKTETPAHFVTVIMGLTQDATHQSFAEAVKYADEWREEAQYLAYERGSQEMLEKVVVEIEKYIPNGSILDISGIKKDIIDRLSLLDDTKTNG